MASSSNKLVALRDPSGAFGCYTEAYHQLYTRSSWVVVRRFASRQLTEGDFVSVFSQFGEVIDVRCTRSHKSGEIVGNCVFIQFQTREGAVLAADNMNSGRSAHGHKVFLTPECARIGLALQVDRCDDAEVPALAPNMESYGQWYQREMLGHSSS